MSGQRAAAEPYTTQFSTSVRSVDGRDVRLETTYFFAESGGQPADTGSIGTNSVENIRLEDGDVVHELAEPDAVRPGQSVLCTVDWERRMYCMRAHTASHALFGAARRLFDSVGYGGFDIGAPDGDLGGDESVRIDFRTDDQIDDAALVDLERRVNRIVWDAHDVSWESASREDALLRDDVAFNEATEEGFAPGDDEIRLVEIENWDVAACGGTHVRNTREIGPVTVLERSNPGEGLTRVEFAVGPAGIDRRVDEKTASAAASRELGTSVADLPDEVARLREERDDLEADCARLREKLVSMRVERLRDEVVDRDGNTWIAGTVEHAGPNDLDEVVRSMAGEAADVIVLAGVDGGTFVVVGAEGVDAGDVVAEVTDEFGGGGGGSPAFAQGGGLDADPAEVVEYLRGE